MRIAVETLRRDREVKEALAAMRCSLVELLVDAPEAIQELDFTTVARLLDT